MKVEINYPGLCPEITPAGNPRWRVRVAGQKRQKITIPFGPSHTDFLRYYEAARDGRKLPIAETVKRSKGTFDELRVRFCEAMETMVKAGNLDKKTLSGRERGLRQACYVKKKNVRMGALRANLPKEAFMFILDSYGEKTGAAETCLKALKAAYRWGQDRGFPDNSPVLSVVSPHVGRGGATTWLESDEQKFLARHGKGTMARRWFFLAKNMAGRIGDTHTMGPRNISLLEDQAYLSWQPQKKGSKPVKVPIMPELAEELDTAPVNPDAFLATKHGAPFASSGGLDNRVRGWIIEAGLCELIVVTDKKTKEVKSEMKAIRSQHGLRKLVAIEIANAGGSVYEIMARLSHSDTKTGMVYTAQFERERLAEQGFRRVQKR